MGGALRSSYVGRFVSSMTFGGHGPAGSLDDCVDRQHECLYRGDLVPDVLANSGGVRVSYYERAQNKQSERWDCTEVAMRLEAPMTSADRRGCDTGEGSRLIYVSKV